MKAYFDFTFLPLLFMQSREVRSAAKLAERFPLPWEINYLHVSQMENLLVRLQLEGNQAQKQSGASIGALWRARLAEGVIAVANPAWDDVWRITIGLHADLTAPVPQPSQLLHLAVARFAAATHFLSLHPPSRQLARRLGFEVLPDKI